MTLKKIKKLSVRQFVSYLQKEYSFLSIYKNKAVYFYDLKFRLI